MQPYLPEKAGHCKATQKYQDTESCLKFESRPITPDNVRIYRKSFFSEPGRRIVHPGLIHDVQQRQDQFPNQKFGIVNKDKVNITSCFPSTSTSDIDEISRLKNESVYASSKKEPLGQSYNRGHVLPNNCQEKEFAFGKDIPSSESAKVLLYPTTINNENNEEHEQMYKKSHGASKPGEQLKRNYNWSSPGINVVTHKFGVKKDIKGSEGTSLCLQPESVDELDRFNTQNEKKRIVAKQVEDMKETKYSHLGQARSLGFGNRSYLPDDHVFGLCDHADDQKWGSRDCIQGSYSIEEQQPDADLGKPVNYGWKNETTETRSFGIPSIRSDIKAPSLSSRSVADNQNYGDDASAKELLYPSQYSWNGVSEADLFGPATRNEILSLFVEMGYPELKDNNEELFNLIWDKVSSHSNNASIDAFRRELNKHVGLKKN